VTARHSIACERATDPLGGRIQWSAEVITKSELMNHKRVIPVSVSMAVNRMTQSKTLKLSSRVYMHLLIEKPAVSKHDVHKFRIICSW
jgi:hypothetical protein